MNRIWKVSGKMNLLLIKKCVGYIWHCCLIYFIDYIVSTLFTEKASTLLNTCIFLNILLIQIQGFPGGKIKKMSWDFHENCHGKPGNVMFFSKSTGHTVS